MIYGYENEKFKIKDSHGKKYEIPIDRPDFHQVYKSKHKRVILIKHIQGQLFKYIKSQDTNSDQTLSKITSIQINSLPSSQEDRMQKLSDQLSYHIQVTFILL